MKKADYKLKQGATDQGIFDNAGKENSSANSFAGTVNEKRNAEDERLKGNEFMRSKEYQEAVDCYTKSLNYHEEASTFSNRAMAYLRLKAYP